MIRFSDIRIRPKLTFFFIMTGIVPLAIVGGIGTYLSTQSLLEKSLEQLRVVQNLRKSQVESAFAERLKDLQTLATNQRIQSLTTELVSYRQKYGIQANASFYIDSEEYRAILKKQLDYCRAFIESYGFYDLSIIAADTGHLMFSTAGENDLGANLATAAYKDNGKAEAWRRASKSGGTTVIVDFAPYGPSKGMESAFIAQPITGFDGQPLGIAVLQIPPSFINKIMDSRKGMGQTGESYLIRWLAEKDQFFFRSDMRTMGDGKYTIGSSLDKAPPYWHDAVKAGKEGGSGLYLDSLGKKVLVTFDKIDMQGMEWFLISKIDRQEVLSSLWIIIRYGLATALVLACGIAMCSWLYTREFTRPLTEDVHFAEAISEGQFNRTLTLRQRDEFGQLAKALNNMAGSLRETNWIKTGKEALHDITRGDHSVEELARHFISCLVKHLEAQIGAFYLIGEGEVLELAASYAFTDRSGNYNRIKIGEGMVGQAALEKEIIYFSKAGADAPALNYGVAEEIPAHFMIAPLFFEDNLIGTFLIGAVRPFTKLERQFIEENLEDTAILFNMAKSRQVIKELLDHTQQQQEVLEMKNAKLAAQTKELKESEAELQAQQEELRVTNEELAEQAKTLRESEGILKSQQEELQKTNAELEERTEALAKQKLALRNKTLELIKAQKEVKKKADDLEISSRYKSEFLANMSHELRTPLNSILILSQLFGKNKDGNLTEKQIESAKAIHTSGSELLNLINEILDLSKVEAGKIELVIEETGLNSFLEDLKRVFKDIATEKKVPFEISVADNVPKTLLTDSQRFQQVLRNLLSNAFKFTHEGKVSLTVSRPTADLLQRGSFSDGEMLAFAVQDQGIGIPKARQTEIFEAFQQVDGSTSRTYGGTGLGLSISKELTRLLGGRIFLESTEGVGSTFTVVVPERYAAVGLKAEYAVDTESFADDSAEVETDKAEEATTPSAETVVPKKEVSTEILTLEPPEGAVSDDRKSVCPEDRSLLIIEDDRKFAAILRDFAREHGFKCIIAENGETGLHFADYYQPSAIILDIGLPGIDGWAVMERLKEDPNLRHIPVHFMSASDKSLDAMRRGAIGFLTKPVSIEKVEEAFAKIENILTKSVRKLLIVEDDSIQRESIRQLIGGNDIETTTVATGKEAFNELCRGEYDCMILDLGLSDMSGFELLAKIRNDRNCAKVPVIVYTGQDLSLKEEDELREYTESIIIKGVKSPERLLDESALFLHRVEANMPVDKQRMLKLVHDKEAVLEGKTILLVDDDMRNVFALSSVLEEKGLNIIVARNGIESLEKIQEHKEIALVLMDIMMPKMDGYEAMRKIREDERLKKLPIIALTAKAMMGDRAKCIEAGANDYLAKPVDTDKLLSMLRVWLYS